MICTPVWRNPTVEYTASLASTLLLLGEHGIRCTFHFVIGGSVLHRSRNELCAIFLASDYTDLLFVDDDMQWDPDSVIRLLASGKTLIGGVGRMRIQKPNTDHSVWCWRPILDDQQHFEIDDKGNIKTLGFGAAFMLINRAVFNIMAEQHPEWHRRGAPEWSEDKRKCYYEFFRQGHEGSDAEISEDYVFCDRVRAAGGACWVDPTITLGHIGSYNYSGSVSEILRAFEA